MGSPSLLRRVAGRALSRQGWGAAYNRVLWSLPADVYQRFERAPRTEKVTTLDVLDRYLARAEELFHESEDQARAFLAGFEYVATDLPDDPFSPEYAAAQWALYEHISGRELYDVTNEESVFDVDEAVTCPYPYNTRSPVVVGDQLIAIGYIVKTLAAQPPARVIEYGAGWGNVTVALATMGYDLTVVELGKNFGELLHARTEGMDNVSIHVSDMLEFQPEGSYDVALFFESFHHCSDHLRMLRQLHDVVGPAGTVVFAAEPIRPFPSPWGLRLDGLSLWSTRRHGWLELGFDTAYFYAALERTGWKAGRTTARLASPLADVIVARPTTA